MKTTFKRIIFALLIAIITSANVFQTSLAEKPPRPTSAFTAPSFCPNAADDPSRVNRILSTMEPGDPTIWTYGNGIGSSNKWVNPASGGISGLYSLWGEDPALSNDSWAIIDTALPGDPTLPSNTTSYLYFKHKFNLQYSTTYQQGYDGGVLEYSIDGGANWLDAQPLFSAGQDYNAIMGNVTVLGSRDAFSGTSDDIVASRYDLSSLAGKAVQFRWRVVSNADTLGGTGWYVDNVEVYHCPANTNVYIGDSFLGDHNVLAGQEKRVSYNTSGGPVIVENKEAAGIVAAIRLQSYAADTLYSFVETMGVPSSLLSSKYYFPSYNNIWAPLDSQIRVGNLNADPIKVKISIGKTVYYEDILGQAEIRVKYVISGGPVIIENVDPDTLLPDPTKKIVAAIRLQSYASNTLYSFSETMGVPAEKMSDIYYFPSYNNIWTPLNSQLRFGVP